MITKLEQHSSTLRHEVILLIFNAEVEQDVLGTCGQYVTVLSDFGRDRMKFQNYEQLFDPLLQTQVLPVENTYILKIQVTYALFDWLGSSCFEINTKNKGAIWDILSEPNVKPNKQDFIDDVSSILQN